MISSEAKRVKISAIIRACRLIIRMSQARPGMLKSDRLYYQMLSDYYTRILNARQEGKLVAAHTVFFPTEILYAMDIVPMHTEMSSWMMALFLGEEAELLSAGADVGLVPEICSPHRGLAGAFALGSLPRPDMMLWSNLICDNTAKSGELLMEINDCPGFFLDHPFQDSEAEVSYLTGELRELVSFLEERTGRKMPWDNLSEIVARLDRQIELSCEINELRKAVPSPFPLQGFLKFLSVDYLFPGQPEAIDYLETLRQELTEMVAQGKGVVSAERFRLMTMFVPPVYLMSFLEKIGQEYGAVSVVEPLFTNWVGAKLDPAEPLESLAKKLDIIPERRGMYGPLREQTLQDVRDCAAQYRVDGALYWAFMGCRHTCATIRLFKDVLHEAGVPMLTLDCDIVDPTINSEAEVREKLERFFELLEARRQPRAVSRAAGVKTLGIDAGSLTTKAVILDGDAILAAVIIPSGSDSEAAVQAACQEAWRRVKLSPGEDLPRAVTGGGAPSVSLGQPPKPVTTCLARGIHYRLPSVRMVIDIGAESSTIVKLDEAGAVSDWATFDKCASGTGIFLQQMAKLMQMPLEEMARLSLAAKTRADISTTCAVFAESEVISHVHREPPTPKEEIVAGIYLSTVRRIMALCKRVGIERDVAVVGGVALNSGLVRVLEEELGFAVLVPDIPQAVAALGAAIIARDSVNWGDGE